jgi:hypothetical protein
MCKRIIQMFLIVIVSVSPSIGRQPVTANVSDSTSSVSGNVTTFFNNGQGVQNRAIFSFSVVRNAHQTRGQAIIQFGDSTIYADIFCLNFVGSHIAVMSGVITRTDDIRFEGQSIYMIAVDNGEGADDPPDGLLALTGSYGCDNFIVGIPAPVEQGNIQVRP